MIDTIQDRYVQGQAIPVKGKRSSFVKLKKKKQSESFYGVQALTQLSGQAKDILRAFCKNENGPVDVTPKDQHYLNAEALRAHASLQENRYVSLREAVNHALECCQDSDAMSQFSEDIPYCANADQAIKGALEVEMMPISKSLDDDTVTLITSKQGRKMFQESLKESIQKECAIAGALAVKSMPRATKLVMPDTVPAQAQEKRKTIKQCAVSLYKKVKTYFPIRTTERQDLEVTRGRSDTYDTMPSSPTSSIGSMQGNQRQENYSFG